MPVSLDGNLCFGECVKCSHQDVPRRFQQNDYPGLVGTEELDQGPAVPRTVVTGWLFGDTKADVGAALENLRSFNDGSTHILVDSEGVSWPNAKFDGMQMETKARLTIRGYTRAYAASFRHLTYPQS